jgi:EAL domain-containing protein (putative c-di-GMP-specific phosphodiesterase class I)
MRLPGAQQRFCITLGPLPAAPPAKTERLQSAAAFAREAEAGLRANQNAILGLLDVQGWTEATALMEPGEHASLRGDIGEALGCVAGPETIVGELAAGRFGVVSRRQLDVAKLASGLEALVQARPAGRALSVGGSAIGLADTGLEPAQAVRAMRFALAKFADGGAGAVAGSGFAAGLAGFIAHVGGQTNALRQIITAKRFELEFQPVVHLGNRSVHHYEALLRPTTMDGMLWRTTQEFVTCAEALGLAEDLDLAVMRQVIEVLNQSDCSIAANVSGLSMQSATFRERLFALLPAGSYRRLLVELTETAEIQDASAAAITLDRLRASSIGLCIDDFGAGAAAFRYLREFRMDYVKIDGAYVQAAMRSEREREIVASMLVLARSVGAQAIVEMIETRQQAQLMQELGATYGQGWLFGRPGTLPMANQ